MVGRLAHQMFTDPGRAFEAVRPTAQIKRYDSLVPAGG
jgi:hypothetical protein